jgi:hypothetical protein
MNHLQVAYASSSDASGSGSPSCSVVWASFVLVIFIFFSSKLRSFENKLARKFFAPRRRVSKLTKHQRIVECISGEQVRAFVEQGQVNQQATEELTSPLFPAFFSFLSFVSLPNRIVNVVEC